MCTESRVQTGQLCVREGERFKQIDQSINIPGQPAEIKPMCGKHCINFIVERLFLFTAAEQKD